MDRSCSTNEETRNAYRIFVVEPEGKRQLGGPRPMWVGNVEIDLREIELAGTDWIILTEDRDQWGGFCEHGDEPSGSLKCWEFLE
jgi:hypothetical protein